MRVSMSNQALRVVLSTLFTVYDALPPLPAFVFLSRVKFASLSVLSHIIAHFGDELMSLT